VNLKRTIFFNPIVRKIGHYIRFLDYYLVKKLGTLNSVTYQFYKNYSIHVYKRRMHSWSPGYLEYRNHLCEELFVSDSPCDPFGATLDERVVELPWVLKNISAGEKVLDAGSALNHEFILSRMEKMDVTIVTLYPEPYRRAKGESYVYEDLRSLSFRDDVFDSIACISTIEHVGFDCSIYKHDSGLKAKDTVAGGRNEVVYELHRVLKPGGKLLISGPCGRPYDSEKFRNLGVADVDELIEAFEPTDFSLKFYLSAEKGWVQVDRESAALAEATYRGGGAAAAGAVFLLELRK
jgi:SAM-dependent methyltransferase